MIDPALTFAVLLGTATFFLVVGGWTMIVAGFQRLLAYSDDVSGSLVRDLSITDITARQFSMVLFLAASIAFLLAILIAENILMGLILGGAVFLLPRAFSGYVKRIRLESFEEKLPAALDELASSARAGLSLAQCFETVARTSPVPISEEFGTIVREYNMGTDLETSLLNARDRIGSKTFSLAVSAFLVNIEKGGNLPEALDTLAASLKEIWRLEQKLFTASAEGRKAMLVIGAVPIFVFVLVLFLQPDIAETLTGTLLGGLLLVVALLLYAGGIFWLRKILDFDV